MTIDELVSEIHRVNGCHLTKRRVLAILRRYVGERVYISERTLDNLDRRALLETLTHSGMERPALVSALAQRAHVSPSTARRWLNGPRTDTR